MPETSEIWKFLINLPHPLEFIWLIWLFFLPGRIAYLVKLNSKHVSLKKGGELVSFQEIGAVGCIGGFLLLTFIFFYTASITLELAGVI